jgi:hypothetical protein
VLVQIVLGTRSIKTAKNVNWQDLSKLKRTGCNQNASSLNALVRVFTNQYSTPRSVSSQTGMDGLWGHRPWIRDDLWRHKPWHRLKYFVKCWNAGYLNSCLVFGYTCLYETVSARDSSGNPFCRWDLRAGAKRLQRIARFECLPVLRILQWEAGTKKAAKRIDTCGMIFFMACVEMITLFRIQVCRN